MDKSKALKIIDELLNMCEELKNQRDNTEGRTKFSNNIISFLENAFAGNSESKITSFKRVSFTPSIYYDGMPKSNWQETFINGLQNTRGLLLAWKEEIENYWEDNDEVSMIQVQRDLSNTCFIVHGQNNEMKLEVKEYISEELGKACIILHKKANEGLTLIEKIEKHSEVDFAVCIWSADDLGRMKIKKDEQLRARQNVIFETGEYSGAN